MRESFDPEAKALVGDVDKPTQAFRPGRRRTRRPRAPASRLRRAVGGNLVGGPTIGDLAGVLGVSERSLQRRLGECGTTFRDEVDTVRQTTAAMLMKDPNLALSEVSWLPGFADPRACTRAFRRWHGTTTSAWRTALR